MFDNIKFFFKAQTSNILVTVIGGLVPVFISGIWAVWANNRTIDFYLDNRENYLFQSIFIIITVYVLIKIRKRTMFDIVDSKEQIKQYMKKTVVLKYMIMTPLNLHIKPFVVLLLNSFMPG